MVSYALPFPQMDVPNAPPELRNTCCHLENVIEDIDKARQLAVCVLCRMSINVTIPFAIGPTTLALANCETEVNVD